ncbi:MAG: TonB-dependent receptor, partial [Saprospiraceae bacterium]
MGGLIILEPTLLKYEPHLHGDIQVNTQTNGRQYGLNTALTKSNALGNMKLTAGLQRSGDKKTPEYYLTNTGNKENSVSLLLANDVGKKHYRKLYYSYYGTEIGILRGSHIGNLTDLKEAFDRKVPFFTQEKFTKIIEAPRQNVHHHLLKYSHVLRFSELNVLHLDVALQANNREEYDVRRANARENPSLDLTLISQFLDVNFTHTSASGTTEHMLGFQNKYSNNTNNPGTGILPLIPDFIGYQNALYYILKSQVWSTPLELGVRSEFRKYDVYEVNQSSNIEQTNNTFINFAANIGVKKEITKELRTQLDISFSSRPPEVNELYSKGLHQGVSGIEEGNRNLVSEFSTKIVNEWIGHISDKLYINASLFYNKLDNFIYLLPTKEERLTIRGAFPVFRYASTDVTMTGLSIKSTYQLSHTISISNQINLIRARNNSSKTGLIWTPPPNISLQLAINAPKSKWYQELKSGLEGSYTFKQTNVDIEEDLLAPPDGYLLMNVFAKIKWKKKYGNDIYLVARSENLLNTVYRDYLNRIRYFADEIGRNISLSVGTSF